MKTLIIRLQIILIVLVVFSPLLYLGYKRFNPQIKLIQHDLNESKNNYPPLLPLHTEGNQIKNTNNQVQILRGTNLISTNWGGNYHNWNPQAIDVAAQDWHVNVIRTRLYEHEYLDNPSEFFLNLETQILDPARRNGLYVILHPWFGENQSLPDQSGIMMWLAVAKRYKNDPHIIFDLLAEPRDITFVELENTYTSLIPKVRAIAPNSLIMVTGLDWGRDINAWLNSPLPYPNLVYRTNPYNKTAEFPGYFGRIALKYPVFLGEFGTEDKLSMSLADVKNILGYADALGIGWTAWHFTQSGCPCLLSDEANFTPSDYGNLVKSNLAGTKTPFNLPVFNADSSRLYVYSDFLESGFADYSWGINNQMGETIKTNFHNASGLFLNTSRRLDPRDYASLNLTFTGNSPEKFSLKFKSWDSQLSKSYALKTGLNTILLKDVGITSISGILIETTSTIADPSPITLDEIYFQK